MRQMTFSSCLTKADSGIVLDASVIINLLATKKADKILMALGMPVVTPEEVAREIAKGAEKGREEFSSLQGLIDKNVIGVVELGAQSLEAFYDLVSGGTANSLGDGEAATLVLSETNSFVAAIDEKKATQRASEVFSSLKMATTIDILSCISVQKNLSGDALMQSILLALRISRMQVWDHQFQWVLDQIGVENAKTCPTLRRHLRSRKLN